MRIYVLRCEHINFVTLFCLLFIFKDNVMQLFPSYSSCFYNIFLICTGILFKSDQKYCNRIAHFRYMWYCDLPLFAVKPFFSKNNAWQVWFWKHNTVYCFRHNSFNLTFFLRMFFTFIVPTNTECEYKKVLD